MTYTVTEKITKSKDGASVKVEVRLWRKGRVVHVLTGATARATMDAFAAELNQLNAPEPPVHVKCGCDGFNFKDSK